MSGLAVIVSMKLDFQGLFCSSIIIPHGAISEFLDLLLSDARFVLCQ